MSILNVNITLLNLVIIFFISLNNYCYAAKNGVVGSAAIPRGKSKDSSSGGLSRIFGQGVVSKLFREIKISFCSELEGLTLQLTRPNDAAIEMSSLENIVNFLNTEYDNPQLVVSLLAKLSRKFYEPNSFTKIKSFLSMHKIIENTSSKAQNAITQSFQTLKQEVDEKVSSNFFSLESIDQLASRASNVAELQYVELTRLYSTYVTDLIELKSDKIQANTASSKAALKNKNKIIINKAEQIINLLEQSELIEKSCKLNLNPLSKQCLEAVKEDKSRMIKELKEIYENILSMDSSETKENVTSEEIKSIKGDIESTLSQFDSKFKPSVSINKTSSKSDNNKIAEQLARKTVSIEEANNIKIPSASAISESIKDKDTIAPEPKVITKQPPKTKKTSKSEKPKKSKDSKSSNKKNKK